MPFSSRVGGGILIVGVWGFRGSGGVASRVGLGDRSTADLSLAAHVVTVGSFEEGGRGDGVTRPLEVGTTAVMEDVRLEPAVD
jgi:hypothetical protein